LQHEPFIPRAYEQAGSEPEFAARSTRRAFLASSALAGAGLAIGASSLARGQQTAGRSRGREPYVGYVSFRRDNEIGIFTMDPDTGAITWRDRVPLAGGPDPLCLDPESRFLYAGCRDRQKLASFRIDPRSGALSPVGEVPLQGEPIQIVTDRTGRFLLGAYFYQSTLGVHAVDDTGAIAFPPVEWRYTAYGAHGVEVDTSNRFVFVPHVARSGGPNAVAQLAFDASTGRLTPNAEPFLYLKGNQGPRHIVCHPTLSVAYSADEQGCSATAYRIDPETGVLIDFQTISTVPGYTPRTEITCSEVQISPDGRFLLVVTREHDSITSFAIDQTSGELTYIGWVPTEPNVRPLALDPQGRFLVAAGSGPFRPTSAGNAGRLVTYEIDPATGALSPMEVYEGGNGPMWILLTELGA
jgi:6-phosphogluconolactonase